MVAEPVTQWQTLRAATDKWRALSWANGRQIMGEKKKVKERYFEDQRLYSPGGK